MSVNGWAAYLVDITVIFRGLTLPGSLIKSHFCCELFFSQNLVEKEHRSSWWTLLLSDLGVFLWQEVPEDIEWWHWEVSFYSEGVQKSNLSRSVHLVLQNFCWVMISASSWIMRRFSYNFALDIMALFLRFSMTSICQKRCQSIYSNLFYWLNWINSVWLYLRCTNLPTTLDLGVFLPILSFRHWQNWILWFTLGLQ